MERYLEGEEISHDEIVTALEDGTDHGHIFPVTCGVATTRLGANRLLDAIVDDLPSPVQHGGLEVEEGFDARARPRRRDVRLRVQDARRPVRGPHQPVPRLPGHDDARHAGAEHPHPPQGARRPAARAARQGGHATPTRSARATSARWPSSRRRTPATGSPRATSRSTMPSIKLPAPVMAFAMEPKTKGDEDKVFTALRRLQEEDPTIDLHRDEQTGEQIVAGLSQIHVEVIVDRMKSRFGAEVDAQAAARALPGDDPRLAPRPTGATRSRPAAAASSATATSRSSRSPDGELRVRQRDQGRRDPARLHPGGREGRARGDAAGRRRRLPGQGRARDGSSTAPTTRSTRRRWRSSWPARIAMQAGARAGQRRCCWSRSCSSPRRCPTSSVGDVMGDLSLAPRAPAGHRGRGRHDRGQGRGADGEMLTYAPDLRSITGGQGEYTLEFLRYEEIPAHLAQKVADKAREEEAEARRA